MRRVNVVGSSCAGKTSLAAALAARRGVPHIELDALHWDPGWTEAPDTVLRERVRRAIETTDGWVVDGNYSTVRDLLWARVDTVVWLDFPLRTILARYLKRTARRLAAREELWNGNRERLAMHLSRRDSLLLWILSTYRRRRREYAELFATRPDLHRVRLRSPTEADRWLRAVR
jgi:adenylate kinase family enzyme